MMECKRDSEHSINKNKGQLNESGKIVVPDYLFGNESPFLWHSLQKRGRGALPNIQRSLEQLKVEETEFSLERSVIYLKLVLEYSMLNDIDHAWSTMKEMENYLEKDSTKDGAFYQKMRLILGHVITSTQAHLCSIDGQIEKSKKLAKNIIPITAMSNHDLAGLSAMKAFFYLDLQYENGISVALQLAREALKLDQTNAEWKILLAIILRQQRKNTPSLAAIFEELRLLEEACGMSEKPSHMVYLAQIYRESATVIFQFHGKEEGYFKSDLYNKTQNMTSKAVTIYKKVLQLEPENPEMLRKVGYGLMNFPKNHADYGLAEKCLLRSLELNETEAILHILGTFYFRWVKDYQKALVYFEKCVKLCSVYGLTDMIKTKFKIDPRYNPCEDIEEGLKWVVKKEERYNLLVQLGGYYLINRKNFLKSIQYFIRAINEDEDSTLVRKANFKSYFQHTSTPITLYKRLASEALLYLNKITSSPKTEKSLYEELVIKDLLSKISSVDSELVKMKPDLTAERQLGHSSYQRGPNRDQQNTPRKNIQTKVDNWRKK